MAREVYIGVGGIARRVKAIYLGVGGVARKVVDGYVGVNGVARSFIAQYMVNFWSAIQGDEGTTIEEVFTGRQDGVWRLYLKANCQYNTNTGRAFARFRMYDFNLGTNRTLTTNYTASGYGDHADIMLTFMNESGGVISQHSLGNGTQKDFSTTIPTNTKYIDFSLQYGKSGTAAMELLVHSLSIGDVVIL